MKFIDINCDMGENVGDDNAVIRYISSANIACGGHAGDVDTMLKTIELAVANGVYAGAHPGYPDMENFGRLELELTDEAVVETVLSQINLFRNVVDRVGADISHIKLHGALYNRAASDYKLMRLIALSVKSEFGNIPFFTLAGSVSEQAVLDAGGRFLSEGFSDRAYDSAGKLVPRNQERSVIHDGTAIAQRALNMVKFGEIKSIEGMGINMVVDTICIHGDTPGAVGIAKAINTAFIGNGITVGRWDAL